MVLAYSHLRGIDGMMIDFYDYPDKVHEIFQRLTTGYINKLKQIEHDGWLYNNVGNTFVGSVGLSPAMFHEFIFPYHRQVAELFGLTCYACCEPADPFWEDIKTLHNLRRVSVSQWADAEKMSEYLGRDYVYSYKACSSDVAVPSMDEGHVRETLAHTLRHTRDNNVEIILKDLHTIGGKPEQVFRWVEILREEIARIYG